MHGATIKKKIILILMLSLVVSFAIDLPWTSCQTFT